MSVRWLIALTLTPGCVSPNVTGTWLTVEGKGTCTDYTGRHLVTMELGVRSQDDDHREYRVFNCNDGWFATDVYPGSYWISMSALYTVHDEGLGPDIDQLAGSAPAVFVEIGDADVVLPTFLVDVGP